MREFIEDMLLLLVWHAVVIIGYCTRCWKNSVMNDFMARK